MTPRERLAAMFRGTPCAMPPVCLHLWGRYPFEACGVPEVWDAGRGDAFADVYEEFARRFPCDWLHVCEGPAWKSRPQTRGGADSDGPPLTPESVDAWVAENRDGQTFTKEEVLASGMYAHVRDLAERLGERLMIFPNQGAPGSGFPGLSWEDQLLLIQHRPELVRHYVERDGERFLARVAAAGALGASGYIFSEGYAGVCDLISPALFDRVFREPKRRFYRQVRDLGMIGIGYFLGGIEPYIDTIDAIGADAVMLEESKAGFVLDPIVIRKKLEPRAVLFGNVDSQLLLHGTRAAIREEVRRQAAACGYGLFAIANGSPICPGTPAENLDAFIEAAAEL